MPFGEEVVEGCFEIPSCRFEALVARAERLQLGSVSSLRRTPFSARRRVVSSSTDSTQSSEGVEATSWYSSAESGIASPRRIDSAQICCTVAGSRTPRSN